MKDGVPVRTNPIPMKKPTPTSTSSSLRSFTDSPLAEAVLEPMTAKLLQETLQIQRISPAKLARKLGLPLPLLEDAIQGRSALKIGIWKAVAAILKLQPENYHFRAAERGECWELYNIYVVTSG